MFQCQFWAGWDLCSHRISLFVHKALWRCDWVYIWASCAVGFILVRYGAKRYVQHLCHVSDINFSLTVSFWRCTLSRECISTMSEATDEACSLGCVIHIMGSVIQNLQGFDRTNSSKSRIYMVLTEQIPPNPEFTGFWQNKFLQIQNLQCFDNKFLQIQNLQGFDNRFLQIQNLWGFDRTNSSKSRIYRVLTEQIPPNICAKLHGVMPQKTVWH